MNKAAQQGPTPPDPGSRGIAPTGRLSISQVIELPWQRAKARQAGKPRRKRKSKKPKPTKKRRKRTRRRLPTTEEMADKRKALRPPKRFLSYTAYLSSPLWYYNRRCRLRLDHRKCEYCGRKATTVHHIKYPSDLRDDNPELTRSACGVCHAAQHGIILIPRQDTGELAWQQSHIRAIMAEEP